MAEMPCQSPALAPVENIIEKENEEMVVPALLEHLSGGSGDCLGSVEAFFCQMCNKRYQQPRVLRCLHVLCTPCLEKLLENDNIGQQNSAETTSEKCSTGPFALACPLCRQETYIETAVSELPLDVVTMNAIDASDISALRMQCTSCKVDERAVARCMDCASFLCSNCVTAHKYMRLFENHKVESFDDLQKGDGVTIHKPFFCSIHPVENVTFFCNLCQIPVCSDCMLSVHKSPEHVCESIADIELKQCEEINAIKEEMHAKIDECEKASANLESVLTDLQQQHDNAQELIKETCQSYEAMLHRKKDELLKELENIQSSGEHEIMDLYHRVEKAIEQMNTACQFTDRVLKNGDGVEVLSMKKHITMQSLALLANIPRLESAVVIEFKTDPGSFASSVSEKFGYFVKPRSKDPTTQLAGTGIPLASQVNGTAGKPVKTEYPHGSSVSPEMVAMLAGAAAGDANNFPMGHPAMSTLQMLVERSMMAAAHRSMRPPAGSIHGMPIDCVDLPVTSSFSMNTLMKLGPPFSVSLPGHRSGLNMNNSAALHASFVQRRAAIASTASADNAAFTGLINSGMLTSSPPSGVSPGTNSQLGDLGALLSKATPSSTSPISAASMISQQNIALDGNLIGPPVLPFGITDDTGIVRIRSSGKVSAMQIRCKFGQLGPGKCQFNSPHGFCLGMDEDIVVADTNNHRVQVFEKTGEFKYQFGVPGREEGQMWYPRKVAVIRASGKYVVCDRGSERSRMQIFTKSGQFIKKIAIRYIDIVAGLAITSLGHIVAVDSVSPTVFCISESGDLIRWFDCSDYMREPSDIAISGKEYFVCDFKGHCVVVFNEDGQFMHRIGCENITNYPNGIDISDAGDVLIGDSHGNRFHIAVFQRDGSLIGEFECPYVKVSRCCGLKITSEGYVVTLAKNNQHVLVLNTLYIA